MTAFPERPLTILVAALGGEGGAVLADWIRDAAIASGFPIQGTSIPGVAQRTGATTYYLELYPVQVSALGGRQPVFALTPSPDNIDLMVASELVEAGRAMQNGYVSARTTLIAATHRVYATSEKMNMGDGRFDAARILEAGPRLARRAVFIDMARMAQEARTVISAVMFGAIAGSGVLPFSRAACEAAIRGGEVGIDGSLRGFAAGYSAFTAGTPAGSTPLPIDGPSSTAPRAEASTLPDALERRIESGFRAPARAMLREGVRRVLDYQDARYAMLYLDRLAGIARATDQNEVNDCAVVIETARFAALWMSYEDIIRVADLKTRTARMARVRGEVLASDNEPVHVIEYLRPGLPELCDMLPVQLSRRLAAWGARNGRAKRIGFGMHVRTSSISGFAMLRVLALLRRWRPRSARFAREQAAIEAWLAVIRTALASDPVLALETALAARLIKGYGETHERGAASFARVMAIAGDETRTAAARAGAVRTAREAALADPEGKLGVPKVREHPLRFVRRGTAKQG